MPRRLELRDLRSLERRSMYSIFHPFDAAEAMPREVVDEGIRRRRRQLQDIWIGDELFLPALLITFMGLALLRLPALLAFVVTVLAVGGAYFLIAAMRRS
ncbi:MAG TPA: hypothetical protein VJQ08_06045 [Candidatus Dormibacteraeota bacterium]|nr:hypothetical protein [Candidatus Dormibacteraeota bacterium]